MTNRKSNSMILFFIMASVAFVTAFLIFTIIRHHNAKPLVFTSPPPHVIQSDAIPNTAPVEIFPDKGMTPQVVANLIAQHSLPDPALSPGMALPGVTAEMVSVPGYAKSVRDVPESEKRKVYEEYGITSHEPGEYEIDHIISLEIGGSNDIKNLFPQSYHGAWNAHMKDKLEDHLHMLVAHKEITIEQAQFEISHNWIIAYKKYFGDVSQ